MEIIPIICVVILFITVVCVFYLPESLYFDINRDYFVIEHKQGKKVLYYTVRQTYRKKINRIIYGDNFDVRVYKNRFTYIKRFASLEEIYKFVCETKRNSEKITQTFIYKVHVH